MAPPYKFLPLSTNNDGKHIRILTVNEGSGESRLECTIEHHELPHVVDYATVDARSDFRSAQRGGSTSLQHTAVNTVVKYEALSWTWGDDASDNSPLLHIRDARGWWVFGVQTNLYSALKHLRKSTEKRNLWIDAVCINQHEDEERNMQVAMMSDIYGQANNVCIWLGEEARSSDLAFDFIDREVSDIGRFEAIIDETYQKQWQALGALMVRPWFNRRWVVQEIALAMDATVHCGSRCVNWKDFETAVALFERDAVRIAKFYRGSETTHYDADYFGEVAAMGAARLVQAKGNLFRRDDDKRIIEYKFTLGELVSKLSSFEAKEPHDMIYAILALGKDTYTRATAKDPPRADADATKASDVSHESTNPPKSADSGSPAIPAVRVDTIASNGQVQQSAQSSAANKASRLIKAALSERSTVAGAPDMRTETSSSESQKRHLPADIARDTAQSSHPLVNDPFEPPTKKQKLSAIDTTALSTPGSKTPEKSPTVLESVVSTFRRTIEPENARVFRVNYKQPFFEVCKRFLAHTIPRTDRHPLDILCRPWAPEPSKNADQLPSWIPSVEKAAFGRRNTEYAPGGYQISRKNADPLVGYASQYNACQSVRAHYNARKPSDGDWYFGSSEKEDPDYKSLFVTGFPLDHVGELSTHCQNGDIPMEWLEMAGWNPWEYTTPGRPSNVPDPPDGLWRTLIADRGPDGINAPVYYPSVFKYAVLHSTEKNGLETSVLATRHNSLLVEFLKRMKAVVWKRRMFKSEAHKFLGLVPMEAKTGDSKCLTYSSYDFFGY